MSNIGKISQVIGAVVDVEFEEKMPDILNALKIEQKGDPAKGTLDFDITLEVASAPRRRQGQDRCDAGYRRSCQGNGCC